jgi:hypothetical protein
MTVRYRVIVVLSLALAASRAPAAERTFAKSTELKKRTAKTSEDVDKYATQLDRTERALLSLAQHPGKGLSKRYKSFSKEVDKLEEAQKQVTSAINEMTSKGAQYYLSWGKTIAQIQDAELRQAGMEQRSKLTHDYDSLDTSLGDIGRQLQPFMKDLRDVKAFLGADLTSENVQQASGMIQNSRDGARALRDRIAGVQITLKQFLNESSK